MALNVVSSDRLSTNVKTSNLATGLSGKVGSSKNLIINGAMQVAQRGTSGTTNGYGSVDRFAVWYGGTDEAPTQEQVSLTSGAPFDVGFKKAFKLTNGNQTSGAGADDSIEIQTALEGQDINSSGWVASDPNSKLTISYWVKSSVGQTFYMRFRAFASSEYEYTYSVALSAATWTKVTKTIPGNANFSSIVTTNAKGFFHSWALFNGTDQTNNKTLDQWAVKDNANKSPDCTSTWYTTNDATFEITGAQLEAGDTATDFEFMSYGKDLERCSRYYWRITEWNGDNNKGIGIGWYHSSSDARVLIHLPVAMRTPPSVVSNDTSNSWYINAGSGGDLLNDWVLYSATERVVIVKNASDVSGTAGEAGWCASETSDASLAFNAEL